LVSFFFSSASVLLIFAPFPFLLIHQIAAAAGASFSEATVRSAFAHSRAAVESSSSAHHRSRFPRANNHIRRRCCTPALTCQGRDVRGTMQLRHSAGRQRIPRLHTRSPPPLACWLVGYVVSGRLGLLAPIRFD
jgi:hypothetical protein